MEKMINNRLIDYKDIVINTTKTKFSFLDRVRILFGSKVIIRSEIYTAEVANVLASEAKVFVTPIFKRNKTVGMMAPMFDDREYKIDKILER